MCFDISFLPPPSSFGISEMIQVPRLRGQHYCTALVRGLSLGIPWRFYTKTDVSMSRIRILLHLLPTAPDETPEQNKKQSGYKTFLTFKLYLCTNTQAPASPHAHQISCIL
ncbi:hypothetical protein ABKN59_005120 [Abortiporus biennis]